MLNILKRVFGGWTKWVEEHPRMVRWGGFAVAATGAGLVFYLRFPNNYLNPNFYAEDGWVYAQNIVDNGFWRALTTTFNGYYIAGIYLLQGLGWVVAEVLFDGRLAAVPQSFAIVSYGFLGVCAALPVLLFREILPGPARYWLVLMATFVPMPLFDYGIIGTLANIKFIFAYVAVLLLMYRHFLPDRSRLFWVVDAVLVVCAYTTITVYAFMPFALIRYWTVVKRGGIKVLRRTPSFFSLAASSAIMVFQLVVIKLEGIPPLPGFYDQPFKFSALIEVFAGRSVLFGYIYSFYGYLTDALALLLLLALTAGSLIFSPRRLRVLAGFSLVAALVTTALFVAKRSGVSLLFKDYGNGGPDHYFYAQNLIALVAGACLIQGIADRVRSRWLKVGIYTAAFLLLLQVPLGSTFGANNFMADTRGTIEENLARACADNDKGAIEIKVYPQDPFVFRSGRDQLCRPENLQRQDRAKLYIAAAGDEVIQNPGVNSQFSQTFKVPGDGFKGINLLLATYGLPVKDPYRFSLFESDCQTLIAEVRLRSIKITDNGYYPVTFKKQSYSSGKDYCFTVRAEKPPNGLMALRLTVPGAYSQGHLILDGQPAEKDVVFELIY
jgi:hypothetical protein